MSDNELEDEIRAQVDEWSSDSTECFNITLLRGHDIEHASFQPTFTYPIFGGEQVIFGYQDLSINLTFAAYDMRPKLEIDYGKQFQAIGDIKPTDIKEVIKDFLPAEAFHTASMHWERAKPFRPPGQRIKTYQKDGETFEVWCASLSDPEARRIIENMQILVPLMIEGGGPLELEQDWTTERWKLYLLYQVYQDTPKDYPPYALVGYGTSYRIFTLPDRNDSSSADLDLFTCPPEFKQQLYSSSPSSDLSALLAHPTLSGPLDLPSRERLSQFLILPTFQGASHGQRLYQTMYTHLTSFPNIRELTVEDPNEAFDDLRDLCDLLHLRAKFPAFVSLAVSTDIPAEALTPTSFIPTDLIVNSAIRSEIRRASKIETRQFDRMVEIQTLSRIPPLHRSKARITKKEKATNPLDKAYYLWRLYVKYRLYVHNRDQLMQLDASERPERVEAAVDSVTEGYGALLERVEGKEREESEEKVEVEEDVQEGVRERRERKRKVVEEEEDEDEDGDGEVEVQEMRKKQKVVVGNGSQKKGKKGKK